MPFSARQGFFTVGTSEPIYDWPGYVNASVFTAEVTNDFTGSGIYTGSKVTVGSMGYRGAILADNGNIYMCPRQQTNMLELDPSDDSFTKISLSGVSAKEYTGGMLASNGNIYCPAFEGGTKILEFEPSTGNNFEVVPNTSHGNYYLNTRNIGGCTLPSGNVMFQPRNSGGSFTNYDPVTNKPIKAGTKSLSMDFEYMGCVPHPNGNVYVMPFNGGKVSYVNESTDTWTDVDVSSVVGSQACQGGVIMADGRICGVPYASNGIFVFDPSDDSFYLDTYGTSWSTSSQSYIGGALGADGNIYFANFNLTSGEEHIFDTQANTVIRNTGIVHNTQNNVGAVAAPNGHVYFVADSGNDSAKKDTTGTATNGEVLKSPHMNKGF